MEVEYRSDAEADRILVRCADPTLSLALVELYFRNEGDAYVKPFPPGADDTVGIALLATPTLTATSRKSFPARSSSIYVDITPAMPATTTIKLETRAGVVLKTLTRTLSAGTTRITIPLARGLKAALYLIKVSDATGPLTSNATVIVRLT
ncbi:MAG TPA: hypothetical protein VFM96_04630 [Gaiellaceae bacterium]|nr:hypothetical protein [Gaiellaceae bacterium]